MAQETEAKNGRVTPKSTKKRSLGECSTSEKIPPAQMASLDSVLVKALSEKMNSSEKRRKDELAERTLKSKKDTFKEESTFRRLELEESKEARRLQLEDDREARRMQHEMSMRQTELMLAALNSKK